MKTQRDYLGENRSFSERVRALLERPARLIVSAALITALSAGALVGCGQTANGSSAASTSTSSSASITPTSTTVPTNSGSGQIASQVASDISSMDFSYSDRDMDGSYDESTATKIVLSGSGATVAGEGVSVSGSVVTISQEGTYIISGSASDAQIVVAADDSAKVQIVLAGVDMTCNCGPCINVETADKVFVTLADGSVNTLTDGSWQLTGTDGEPNATIYSESDLTVNGSGSLTINATVHHGISTKDDLTITGGTINVTAADDGLHGKDSVSICGATITIDAGGDGIKSTNDTKEDKGFVTIDGGKIDINAADDGIQATRLIQTTGGLLNVKSGDDALHSDLDILINGGDTTINAGDDAVHGEYFVDIVSGNLTVESSYEGIEGQAIEIAGGNVKVTSTDDGLNSSVASTATEDEQQATETEARAQEQAMDQQRFQQFQNNGMQGAGMKQGMMETSEECVILISGGETTLTCEGDSIDSNGSVSMTGGVVYVSGTTRSGNGALDTGSGATIAGGTILATSAGGMEESFGSSSTQASIAANVSGNAGDTVSVSDASGKEIVSFTAAHAFSWVLASSADITSGSTYTVKVNGSDSATATATTEQQAQGMGGAPMGGMQQGGKQRG